jgi:predicted enzyme related to lactoylglutathione lyase
VSTKGISVTGTLTHFEIYGDDPETLAAFYRSVMGWSIERAQGVDYWRIDTGASRGVGCGGLARKPGFAQSGWMSFVQVASVDAAIAATTASGGAVLKEKSAVPRTAWHAVIADPAGNAFVVWEPDPHAMPIPEPD